MPVTLPASPAIADRSAVAAYYSEHGFYHARGLISPSRLAELERDFDRIVTQLEASGADINARWKQDTTTALDGGGGVVIHTHQVQKYSAAWGRFLYDEGTLDVAECLTAAAQRQRRPRRHRRHDRSAAPARGRWSTPRRPISRWRVRNFRRVPKAGFTRAGAPG